MAVDPYNGYDNIMSSSRKFFGIVPSDSAALPTIPKGVYVGGGGNITMRGADGDDVVLVAVQAGSLLPISPTLIKAAGTTATFLVGLA